MIWLDEQIKMVETEIAADTRMVKYSKEQVDEWQKKLDLHTDHLTRLKVEKKRK